MSLDRALAEFPEMNPGPVLRLDRTGHVVLANAAARALFRCEDVVGRPWPDLCPGAAGPAWKAALEAEEPVQVEAEIHGATLIFTLARRPDGREVFVYGNDVTELKRAERILAQQAAELAELARFPEMNPGPVCRLDMDGCVVLAYKAVRNLFSEENPVGRRWPDVCPGVTAEFWERVVGSKDVVTHEVRIRERTLMFTYTPDIEGRHIFLYGSDVTSQKVAERALMQSEKMATLGTLAAGVAHELNNPAAAAQRAAEQLRVAFEALRRSELELRTMNFTADDLEVLAHLDQKVREAGACACNLEPLARVDSEARLEDWLEDHGVDDAWELAPALVELGYEPAALDALATNIGDVRIGPVLTWLSRAQPVYSLLEEIRHGAARVSEIVTALKTYSYVGRAPVQAVDVNDGIRQTLIIMRTKLKAGVTVDQDFDRELPRIQAHGSELNQVWTNLIDNAVDAMGGHGRLAIRTSLGGGNVVVEIEDDGPGIPEEIQSRIFDPFFTTKPLGKGTGLGLNTSYSIIVKRHGGAIDVTSRPGCTCFTVRLPMDAARAGAKLVPDSTEGAEGEPRKEA